MIKYNNSNINDWYFAEDNIVKLYRNGAVVYYKVITSGDTPEYQVCYAVVDDISQYQDREFVDVFNKADEKWYKLNNLNQYEEYGVYGTSTAETQSRLPQGYTEVEYVEDSGSQYIDTGVYLNTSNFEIGYEIIGNKQLFGYSHQHQGSGTWFGAEQSAYMFWGTNSNYTNISSYLVSEGNTVIFTPSGATVNGNTISKTLSMGSDDISNIPLVIFARYDFYVNGIEYRTDSYTKFKSFYIKNNDTLVRDFVPAMRDNDSKYGLYDLITDTFYTSPNGNDFLGGSPVTPTSATYYEGKLAIVDGYEYMYSGSSWVNVGEVSGSTATLPNVPFSVNYNANNYDANTKTLLKTSGQLVDTDAVITAGTPTVHDGYLTIASGTRATISGYSTYFNRTNSNGSRALTIVSKQKTESSNCHMFANRDSNYNWMYRCYSNKLTLHGGSETGSIAVTTQPVIESVRVQDSSPMIVYNNYTNNTTSSTSSFSYGSTNNGKFAMFQGYGTTTGENFVGDFYWVYMSQNTLTDEQIQQVIDYNEGGGGQSEYPLYYDEKADPLNNLTFETMEDAQDYAYNNCVYDGMRATIGGDRYYFDSEDENGWVKILSYYTVEDVSPDGTSGWTITGSSTYNPQPSYYDDFSIENNTAANVSKIAKITIFGYDHFTYYLRSYGYGGYAYVTSTNLDEIQTDPTSMIGYNTSSAITNTYYFNKNAGSDVNLSNYRRVTYNNLDKTVEHTFYVTFYGSSNGSFYANGTILIPKEQTNENWEQVTFSSSTNVSGTSKNLYIDGNNSSSGGTSYFNSRWIVGLPSGSHSSYTNYTSYNYCPSTTSSTFTSVAGEQRQVNFTYNNTSDKTLQFRLVDESGNTISTSSTVYYNMVLYNSCGVTSNNSNLTFPRSQSVKVGGSFQFSNSSNRHYIYGYTPNIRFSTSYYSDNYNTYFDIPYTKLDTETVTITYTTYDPDDTEVPTFKTDITYPYNGGTTSSTTLTSYEVPYTYSYTVAQTSNLFSASTASYTYTAGQTSRTITFTSLYPNNREFSTVADLEAYQYAWEGMNASVGGTKYKYTNGSWVEETYTKYEYIRTENATSKYYMFNTNFYPTTANTFEVKVEFVDRSIDWGAIIEWRPGGTQNFEFDTVTGSYQAIIRTGGNNGVTYRPTIGANNPTVYTLPLSASSGTYSINGGSTQTISYNYTTMSLPANTPMGIFGDATKKDLSGAVAKLYYLKVYDGNGNLVKHYVPSDSNGTPCLYEIINGDYILNTYSGTDKGTCTLGPAI